jgi:hypothetical protein
MPVNRLRGDINALTGPCLRLMASYRLDDMKTASRQFADSEPSCYPDPRGVSVAAAGFHRGLDRFGVRIGCTHCPANDASWRANDASGDGRWPAQWVSHRR